MDEVSSLDWDVVPKDGFDYDWVKDDIERVKSFLLKPNKNDEPFSLLVRAWLKDVLEIDAGVLVKVFDVNSYDFNEIEPKSGAPMLKPLGQRNMTEIYVRDGASFLKEIDKFGFCKGYWQYSYQIPAHPMWFNRDEIVYCSEHNRSMSCYGFARSQAVLDVVKSLHYSTLYNKRFFEETSIPDGALSLLDTNEAEMKAFLNWWNGEFKAQPHKLAVINKDVKWQPFNMNNNELQFLETQKWYYNLVIGAYGLTPSELGITDNVNKSTSATQSEVVKRKGIRPFLKLFESFVNSGIIPEFGVEGVEFQFIYDDPGEKRMRLENWQIELNMGVKTINEVREEMGLEPVEGGDAVGGPMARQNEVPGKPQKDDAQSSGYSSTLEREQKGDNVRSKSADADVRSAVRNPFSTNNRPVGNMKGVEKDYKKLSREELIAEHKRLVEILLHGSDDDRKKEAARQKKELEEYLAADG